MWPANHDNIGFSPTFIYLLITIEVYDSPVEHLIGQLLKHLLNQLLKHLDDLNQAMSSKDGSELVEVLELTTGARMLQLKHDLGKADRGLKEQWKVMSINRFLNFKSSLILFY